MDLEEVLKKKGSLAEVQAYHDWQNAKRQTNFDKWLDYLIIRHENRKAEESKAPKYNWIIEQIKSAF